MTVRAVGMMHESQWKADDRVQARNVEKHSRVFASQIIEDGARRQRRLEDLGEQGWHT